MDFPVAIIGAGLSGLSLALHLEQLGHDCVLFEADSGVGGRVQTDEVDGFFLDRGFQVVLNNYPQIERLFPDNELSLAYFESGALFRLGHEWASLRNPLSHPAALFQVPRQFWADLFKFLPLYREDPETVSFSTAELLAQYQFSEGFMEGFLRPFFAGVFLEKDLKTCARVFLRLLPLFTWGRVGLPKGGMQSLSQTLRRKLKRSQVQLNQRVERIEGHHITLNSGQSFSSKCIALATDLPHLHELLSLPTPSSRQVDCYYYAVPKGAVPDRPILYLNGTEGGPINNLSVNSAVQPTYAPPGQHLVSATVLDSRWQEETGVSRSVAIQAAEWFGSAPGDWRCIGQYSIPHALPDQSQPIEPPILYEIRPNVFLCNELVGTASINGALNTGQTVAQKIHQKLKGA